jgi:hypothetical protein
MIHWLPSANDSQRRLDALISGLFSVWMRGPSQATARYLSLVPQATTGRMPAREQRALQTLGRDEEIACIEDELRALLAEDCAWGMAATRLQSIPGVGLVTSA